MNQTIAAIATPAGAGGVGIVRISGDDARTVAAAVFRGKADLTTCEGYTAHYGRVYDGETLLDEAVALVFAAPKSYTGEDVVELSCHGGVYVVNRVLKAVIAAGARPAEGGEFTRRAFENGKLELTEAEAVIDIISAGGQQALNAALCAKSGGVSREIGEINGVLTFAAAGIAAFMDFPDEGLPELDWDGLISLLEQGKERLQQLLERFDQGRILREGITTVIVGRPNVGKSTLMNVLTGWERSIVTEHAGTTRDVVEETVRIGDLTLRLWDTAGLRETEDPVEKIGVELARERMNQADLVLAVLDGSAPLEDEDRAALAAVAKKPTVVILNKSDLPLRIMPKDLPVEETPVICVSAKEKTGVEELERAIAETVGLSRLEEGAAVLQNARQWDCARRALEGVERTLRAVESGVTLDAAGVDLDDALAALAELTGTRVSDRVVNEVFSHFCVGK